MLDPEMIQTRWYKLTQTHTACLFSCQICLLQCYSLYSISGFAFGIPGRPVRLVCETTIGNGRDLLKWMQVDHPHSRERARGDYVDGDPKHPTYFDMQMHERAELSQDGSLTIHSYEDEDAGWYYCYSQSQQVGYYLSLITFSKYIVWNVDIIFMIYFVISIRTY